MGLSKFWSARLPAPKPLPQLCQRSKMALFLMSLSVLKRYLSMLSINGAPQETRTPTPFDTRT